MLCLLRLLNVSVCLHVQLMELYNSLVQLPDGNVVWLQLIWPGFVSLKKSDGIFIGKKVHNTFDIPAKEGREEEQSSYYRCKVHGRDGRRCEQVTSLPFEGDPWFLSPFAVAGGRRVAKF